MTNFENLPLIDPADCYKIPTGWLSGRPGRMTRVATTSGELLLRNLRPFPDVRGERYRPAETLTDEYTQRLATVFRDGDGHGGRPEGYEKWARSEAPLSFYESQAAELNDIVEAVVPAVWVAFDAPGYPPSRRLPIAPLRGVVLDMLYPGPRYQPVIENRLGELALLPVKYHAGYPHVVTQA